MLRSSSTCSSLFFQLLLSLSLYLLSPVFSSLPFSQSTSDFNCHKKQQINIYSTVVNNMLVTAKIRKSEGIKDDTAELCKWISLIMKYVRDSSMDVLTKLWAGLLRSQSLFFDRGRRYFSPAKRPDWL
jgi:hypothetical protein